MAWLLRYRDKHGDFTDNFSDETTAIRAACALKTAGFEIYTIASEKGELERHAFARLYDDWKRLFW